MTRGTAIRRSRGPVEENDGHRTARRAGDPAPPGAAAPEREPGPGAAPGAGAAGAAADTSAGGAAPLWGLLEVTVPIPEEVAVLDDIDRRLLALLAGDSRASQRKLARDLHMSAPAVGERIARLERSGVIRGYTISIDWAALGYDSVYLVVTAVQGADQAAILRALRDLPEVEEIMVITGAMDMLARLRVRDHAHLRQILLSQIWRIEGVQRTETFVALAEMPAKFGYIADLLERSPRSDPRSDGATTGSDGASPGPGAGRGASDTDGARGTRDGWDGAAMGAKVADESHPAGATRAPREGRQRGRASARHITDTRR